MSRVDEPAHPDGFAASRSPLRGGEPNDAEHATPRRATPRDAAHSRNAQNGGPPQAKLPRATIGCMLSGMKDPKHLPRPEGQAHGW
ncbi:hypothetical protein [Sorangium sp. So ce145]|uniref:hypothetical protein n=1 Tax=Sorangium sp. So ce145 TaxID=3133285 RepID=UPI003F5F59F3